MGNRCSCHTCPAREFGIFSSLNDADLRKTKNLPHQNFYKKHQIIFHEESPCQGFYIMRRGRAKLIKSNRTGHQQILKLVGPGGIIGEHAVFENSPYVFTAQVIEDSEICFINRDEFLLFLKGKPEIAMRILSILSEELRTTRAQLIDMVLKDARGRMAGLILGLATECGGPKEKGKVLDLYLTRGEMAEIIGVSQETAIRLISEFRDTGLIGIGHRRMTILDENGLKMVASGEQLPPGNAI